VSDTAKTTDPLAFTGERFTPECVREIWYEHWHRYVFAREFVRDKRVLDVACGEGYGSALLAGAAHAVTGIDLSQQAVEHARRRYETQQNLRFECANACDLPLSEASQEVIVSFETLEHLAEQEVLIANFDRVLTSDGMLIISSPDKYTYSDKSGFRNEFHLRELYREEFLALLRPYFSHVYLFGQKLLFQSAIWSLENHVPAYPPQLRTGSTENMEHLQAGLHYDPLYFIAVCCRQPFVLELPTLALFGDKEESVYTHYNHEVRKNMAAGTRISELEAVLATLEQERDSLRSRLEEAKKTLSGNGGYKSLTWWRRFLNKK